MLLPIGVPLQRASFDLPLTLRRDIAAHEAIIVYLDDPSHQRLKQPHHRPWDRGLHAQLLTKLIACGARAVVFDILFSDTGPEATGERALADAIQRAPGQVFLGAQFDKGKGTSKSLELPLRIFRDEADENWGFVDLAPDPDRAVREHFHGYVDWKDTPSLTWRVAAKLGARATQPAGSDRRRRWLNYYGPPGSLPHLSYYEAVDYEYPALMNLVRDKIVFVGLGTVTGYSDQPQEAFLNPYCRLGAARSPGVDIHATQFLNLWRNDWLRRLPPWLEFGLVLFWGGMMGFCLTLVRPWPAVGLGVALMALVAALAMVLAWSQWIWFSWAVLSIVQIPMAVLLAITFSAQRVAAIQPLEETREFASRPADTILNVPDHTLVRRIGSGAYGEVWLAKNVMGGLRAIKVVHRKAFVQDRGFEREFEGLKKFEPISRAHPGLVDILHVGRNDVAGSFYYVMELADDANAGAGDYAPKTLKQVLEERKRLPVRECVEIGLALSSALEFLHAQGLVHRDIKPSNIIFVQDSARLADIGLVTEIAQDASVVGTRGYLAPEGPGAPQADIYSLGMVLYEVAAGIPPSQLSDRVEEITTAHTNENWASFFAIISQATHLDPAKRYPRAADLKQALSRV